MTSKMKFILLLIVAYVAFEFVAPHVYKMFLFHITVLMKVGGSIALALLFTYALKEN